MQILTADTFDRDELVARVRATPLRGFGGVRPYAHARVELVSVSPNDLAPAQRYVLSDGVDRVLALRDALAPSGIDPFALEGGACFSTDESAGSCISLIPPIVEESHEPDGRMVWIINDGLHRVFAARSVGADITVVRIAGVPSEYPYYALALSDGWAGVAVLDELPDVFQKKEYRVSDNYKALFRDFNAVFPGVQAQRKRSNPGNLRA